MPYVDQPFRGQPENKTPHWRFLPPSPNEKRRTRVFWFIAAIIAFGVAYWATTDKTLIWAFAFFCYIQFLVTFFIATQDLQNRERIAQEAYGVHKTQQNDRSEPEPELGNQSAMTHLIYGSGLGCSVVPEIILTLLFIFADTIYMTMTFGARSPITIGALVIFGFVGAIIFLVVQKLRALHNITPQKFTAKNIKYRMGKHSRK